MNLARGLGSACSSDRARDGAEPGAGRGPVWRGPAAGRRGREGDRGAGELGDGGGAQGDEQGEDAVASAAVVEGVAMHGRRQWK